MNTSVFAVVVLLLAVLLANLPFVLGHPGRRQAQTDWPRRLLGLVLAYALFVGLGMLLESQLGPRWPQGWAFYAVTASLFVAFAFPGFVYRYLWQRR